MLDSAKPYWVLQDRDGRPGELIAATDKRSDARMVADALAEIRTHGRVFHVVHRLSPSTDLYTVGTL
jgi:hypothetical protein